MVKELIFKCSVKELILKYLVKELILKCLVKELILKCLVRGVLERNIGCIKGVHLQSIQINDSQNISHPVSPERWQNHYGFSFLYFCVSSRYVFLLNPKLVFVFKVFAGLFESTLMSHTLHHQLMISQIDRLHKETKKKNQQKKYFTFSCVVKSFRFVLTLALIKLRNSQVSRVQKKHLENNHCIYYS